MRARTAETALLALFFLSAGRSAADRSGRSPGWLLPGEASPFFPDDAYTIQPNLDDGGTHDAYFRTTFNLDGKPRRAVIALTSQHVAAVCLNGTLVLETYHPEVERTPRFAELTAFVEAGANTLDLRVHSQWSVELYAQLRLEQADGTFSDVLSDGTWQWHPAPADGWPRGAAPTDGWRPVRAIDDYEGTGGKARRWQRRYALMPRELLHDTMQRHIDAFNTSWPADQAAPKPAFQGDYTQPDYAAQYRDFLHLDQQTGQVLDATGKVRHLFFTIYGQPRGEGNALQVNDFDFDRLEADLAIMEQAQVHPYLRFTGWSWLLDEDGNWQRCEQQPKGTGLPPFTWNFEILDYFVDRCQAHGRFVAIEGDFFWSANWDMLPAPYHTRYYLYPEVAEVNALAHRKILSRYAQRPVVAGYMIGEEDVIMAPDLDNGHLRARFQDYESLRYGTPDKLAATWQRGYDFRDTSQWREVQRKPEQWGTDVDQEAVGYPSYPLQDGLWRELTAWSGLELPVWPRFHAVDPPHAELPSHQSLNTFTPDDPSWIDYNAFREDELYLRFVNAWAATFRAAAPHQWLFHSNAQDFTAQWHFLHFQRRAELDFDVIGVGCHDSGSNLAGIPAWDRMRKYYKNIASYRAYVLAPGSPAAGLSSGEGEGGKEGDEDGVRDYYRAQSFELVGHGAAFEQSYTWPHLSGASGPDSPSKLTQALAWMGDFYRAVDGVSFSLRRPVDVLVVRNNNLQRSNRSGRDYGNGAALADALGQLNLEFDFAMDQDLSLGPTPRKIDLDGYRMVFLPSVDCDYPDEVWRLLDRWLSDPRHRGKRALVLGNIGNRSPYLAPTGGFHPVAAKWLGMQDYASTVALRNDQKLVWSPLQGGTAPRSITLDFGDRDLSPVGVIGAGRALLTTSDGQALAVATTYAGNAVYAFGFPLGLNYDLTWCLPAKQEPYDLLATLYEDLVDATGTARPIRAPHNVRVAVSDDQSVIVVHERFGLETTDLCELKLPPGARYDGCELVPQAGGWTLVRATVEPYGGLCLKRR